MYRTTISSSTGGGAVSPLVQQDPACLYRVDRRCLHDLLGRRCHLRRDRVPYGGGRGPLRPARGHCEELRQNHYVHHRRGMQSCHHHYTQHRKY